jgi:hypothetical protein
MRQTNTRIHKQGACEESSNLKTVSTGTPASVSALAFGVKVVVVEGPILVLLHWKMRICLAREVTLVGHMTPELATLLQDD